MPRGNSREANASPQMVHISPVPAPVESLQASRAHGASGACSTQTPLKLKTPKKNEQEVNDDFDRSFQIDADALTLKHPLANGEGGIGEVWVGELLDNGSVHTVAVKRYPSAFGPEEMKMFRRETAVLFLAAMRCHNVCKVYGTAVKDGKVCIIMKLYKESMRGLLGRTEGNKLSLNDVKRYGGEICKAIAELHEQNIILQDLKPPNILLDEYDHCVLADFGISKFVQGSLPHMPTHVQGTFNYMSPEAFDPEQFGGITSRTDSWSFACTLIEMITGDQPWKEMKMAPICFKVMQHQIPEIPTGLPQVLEEMLRRCFSFEPENRPTFKEMYGVFRSCWGLEDKKTPKSPGDPAPRNFVGNRSCARPPSADAVGAHVDRDSSIAQLYKRAAEAEDAMKQAQVAKKELGDLKNKVLMLQEENDAEKREAKEALAGKEDVVFQLNKVMKVCEELQKERISISQQLLDLQDQRESQEQKISEEIGLRQSAEASRRRAEEELAKLSATHTLQEDDTELQKIAHHLSAKLTAETKSVHTLTVKLNAMTQELIEVTELRDKDREESARLRIEALELSKASRKMQDEYKDLHARHEELRDVHQFELEQAKQQQNKVSSSENRILRQEKEAANTKIRALEADIELKVRLKESADRKIQELETELSNKVRQLEIAKGRSDSELQTAKKELAGARDHLAEVLEEKKLLDRRLAQSALENIKLKQLYDRLLEDKDALDAKSRDHKDKHSAALETSEPQKNSDKERAQWQRDRDSLQSAVKEIASINERLSEAEKRANSLATEKWQMEHERIKILEESESDRMRLDNALSKQRIEYEKRILDLEQAYERLKLNRDSVSTSDDTIVTARSMGNSLELRGDAYTTSCPDDKIDTPGGQVSYSAHSSHSSPDSNSAIGMPVAEPEIDNRNKSNTIDEDRVARVLRQLALECDKQSNPSTAMKSATEATGGEIMAETEITPRSQPSSPPPVMLLSATKTLRSAPPPSSATAEERDHSYSPAQPRVLASRQAVEPPRTPHGSRYNGRMSTGGIIDLEQASQTGQENSPYNTQIYSSDKGLRHRSYSDKEDLRRSVASQPKPKGQSLGLVLEGARVANVMPGSPAQTGGLKPDDVIRKVNGIRVGRDDVGKVLRIQWLGGAEPLEIVADRGQNSFSTVLKPLDGLDVELPLSRSLSLSVDLSNGSLAQGTNRQLQAQLEKDEALAWKLHEEESFLLRQEAEASAIGINDLVC